MKNISIILLFTSIAFLSSCSDDNDDVLGNQNTGLDITFDVVVGDQDLVLEDTYTIHNKSVQISRFRYWISGVKLVKADGDSYVLPDSYFLMEETGSISVQDGAYVYPANKRETINLDNIPVGAYKSIEFSIGVDEIYNDNLSLQSGELSQLNGMTNISWMWHTSYIFSSILGVDLDSETNLKIETGLNTSYRTLSVPFPSNIDVNSNNANTITFKVDILGILEGIDLDATPEVGASTPESMTIMADNFSENAFTLININGTDFK